MVYKTNYANFISQKSKYSLLYIFFLHPQPPSQNHRRPHINTSPLILFIWVQEKMAFGVSKQTNKLVPKSAVSSLNSDCALRVEFINVSSKKIKTFWQNFLSKPLISVRTLYSFNEQISRFFCLKNDVCLTCQV